MRFVHGSLPWMKLSLQMRWCDVGARLFTGMEAYHSIRAPLARIITRLRFEKSWRLRWECANIRMGGNTPAPRHRKADLTGNSD